MNISVNDEAQSSLQQRSFSLGRKVRVRTSHLPNDFFQGGRSKSRTRPSSAARSGNEPSTPTFGKRDFSLIEEVKQERRNKRRDIMDLMRGRSKRYDKSLSGRDIQSKM